MEKKIIKPSEPEKKAIGEQEASDMLSTDFLSDKKNVPAKYSCTIKQFAYFVDATDSAQRTIVKTQKKQEGANHPFWYQTAQSSIAKSLKNGDHTPIYEGITKLKKSTPPGKQGKNNKELSILILEKYLKLSLPLDFRALVKTEIKPDIKTYTYLGVKIKVTPDYVFRASFEGQKIVGAIRINLKKTKPLSSLRMKIISFLLNKYIEKHVAQKNEIVLPQFCLCIDVFANACQSAPKKIDSPIQTLDRACVDYARIWEEVGDN